MQDMEGANDPNETHHLMVYVMDPDGQAVQEAKLGYLVEGPDGTKQKLMAMGMQGAYGAIDPNKSFLGQNSFFSRQSIQKNV